MDASTSSSTLSDSTRVGDDDSESEEAVRPKRPRLGSQRRSIVTTGSGKYRKSWNIQFIVASTKGEKFAHCKLCSRDFSVSHGGHNDAKRHCDSAVHQKKHSELQSNTSITSFFGESSLSHSTKVISAEVMMAQFIALHNLPFQAADHLSDLVTSMFPDSLIAADFSSKHTKTKSIICDALDPFLKEPVIDSLKSTPFNLMCDESNDKGDQCKLLTILVRSFDANTDSIVTRHLETVGITDFTAEGIFSALKDILERYNLPFANVLSFTSDTCNVMKGARGGVIAKLRSVQPKIIDVHCICHLVSLCVKSAVKGLPLKVDDLLVDIYYHFRNSVNRVVSLQEFAEFCCVEFKCILKHCETRWLSLRRAINRTLEMWDPLLSYFTSHVDVEKPGKVKTIFTLMSRPSTKLWLCFLSNVVFDRFNIFFQTSKISTAHKLHGECVRLLKTVLGFFVKPQLIKEHLGDLTKLKYCYTSTHLPDDELFVGDNTTALAVHLSDNEGEILNEFYKGVIQFYQRFIQKQLQKFNFKSQLLQILSFLDPANSQGIKQCTFDQIDDLLPITFDKAVVKLEHREFVLDCDVCCSESDAVKFWVNVYNMKSPMDEHKYKNLATIALKLLSIPTSNVDCERVFSHVRRIKTDFRSSLSTETISSLIGCHFNKTSKCCELTKFEDSLLVRAKQCTHKRNLSYNTSS